MSKGTTIKDAVKLWEEKTKQNSAEAEVIKLLAVIPFLTKMDATIATFTKVRHLSFSSNNIDRISNLNGLQFLTVLSLSRNSIKKIENLEPVADTLVELWLSYNQIERVNGVECCKKLKVLYLAQNKIKGMEGIEKLKEIPALEDLLLFGNPLEEKMTADGNYRDEIGKKLPQIKKLDGKPIFRDEEEQQPAQGGAPQGGEPVQAAA